MLTLHHLHISQSERIVWLLEELSLPYTLITHTRAPLVSPASLTSVPGNLTGKSPFLIDSTPSPPITLSESGAIIEYIIHTYGSGRLAIAPGSPNYAHYLRWFHYANATLQPEMLISMFLAGSNAPFAPFSRQRMDAAWKVLDERLGESRYLAGEEFSATDIMTIYSVTTQRYFGPQDDLSGYGNLMRWVGECTGREAYQRAMMKGDPEMKLAVDGKPPASLVAEGGVEGGCWRK